MIAGYLHSRMKLNELVQKKHWKCPDIIATIDSENTNEMYTKNRIAPINSCRLSLCELIQSADGVLDMVRKAMKASKAKTANWLMKLGLQMALLSEIWYIFLK